MASPAETMPGTADIHVDVLLGVLTLQEEQLGDNEAGCLVAEGIPHEYDPLLQQAGIDVVGPLPVPFTLDDERYEC
jgi:hypothetical protein